MKSLFASRTRKGVTTKKRKEGVVLGNLPPAPTLIQTLGPSFILLGLALGSGELILWPYLTANYGLGLLWGALLGISLQYLLNTEVMRYSLAWGESVFVGFRKLSHLIPIWYIISTFVPWSLPGFSSASAEILHSLFPWIPVEGTMALLLILTGILLTGGKTLYLTMEKFEKLIVFVSIPFVVLLVALFTEPSDWQAAVWGIVGKGDGWWFFPPNIAIVSFLGAFAYAGGGGNLNLAQSYYIKAKGFGMGKFANEIKSFLYGGAKPVQIEGQTFLHTPTNHKKWKQWWLLVTFEHGIVFWLTGFLTITLLAVLAYSLAYGSSVSSGLSFVYHQASVMSLRFPGFGNVYLLAAAIMLFSTQFVVLEASSRMISENILLLFYKKGKKFNMSLAFYTALWGQVALGLFLIVSGIQEPKFLLTLAAALNAGAMMVAFPLLYWLNTTHLGEAYRPGILRRILMVVAFLLFALFVGVTLWSVR